ncbi:hypothetical protein FOXG_18985 [Fusarium oxysporum f. sp. lycopersici 4287]|uniref:Uncharacterized protein n=1 Tax=Fusarium oxysporum f. sp. lycopersici (strain 4287 / CBS 123668 / FGSC 9935 / NRRL 34936) TaxID=426428 RepID=A0A0J9UR74_FUSO4|nr:hypothetical protein FOXG_18985 [Fusarium oxysporum f. sp. lycopersici 4287]KNB02054.1 hypothetical protein FOXG_18985 [Fusarium oxysporum f. sp. lycopersici 4287]
MSVSVFPFVLVEDDCAGLLARAVPDDILSRDPFVMIGAVSISDRSRGQSLSILQDLRKSRASIINATERCSRSRLFTAKASPNSDLVNRRVSICMDILMMDGSMSLRIASMVCSLKSSKIVTDSDVLGQFAKQNLHHCCNVRYGDIPTMSVVDLLRS